jgi:hypothetical protein
VTLLLLIVVALLLWAGSLYFWPFAPCRRCEGTGRNGGSNRQRFGDCPACDGSGRRMRFGAQAVHRTVRSRMYRKIRK